MIMGFIVSTTVSALILELTFYRREHFDFLESFIQHMRWDPAGAHVRFCGLSNGHASERIGDSRQADFGSCVAFSWVGIGRRHIMLYATTT